MARNRLLIVAGLITLIFGLVICIGISATLLVLHWLPTPVPTDLPTVAVPTWTASPTPSPTNMTIPEAERSGTSTPTLTPTPTPTNTPASTDTPTPTDTPTATSTLTSRPTVARPTATDTPIPPPTNTPKPALAWTGAILDGFENCGQTRLFGFARAQDDKLVGDVWLHFWGDGASGWSVSSWTLTFGSDTKWEGDEGNWEAIIDKKTARAGVWHVCVVPAENSTTCISNIVDVTTDTNCHRGTQVLWLDFRQN